VTLPGLALYWSALGTYVFVFQDLHHPHAEFVRLHYTPKHCLAWNKELSRVYAEKYALPE